MSMYHRKQEKMPSDRKETSKLLVREQAVHSKKGLAKDEKHIPHHKDKPVKKAATKPVKKVSAKPATKKAVKKAPAKAVKKVSKKK